MKNKKLLYEAIMSDVSRVVKKHLNELSSEFADAAAKKAWGEFVKNNRISHNRDAESGEPFVYGEEERRIASEMARKRLGQAEYFANYRDWRKDNEGEERLSDYIKKQQSKKYKDSECSEDLLDLYQDEFMDACDYIMDGREYADWFNNVKDVLSPSDARCIWNAAREDVQ